MKCAFYVNTQPETTPARATGHIGCNTKILKRHLYLLYPKTRANVPTHCYKFYVCVYDLHELRVSVYFQEFYP